MMTTRLSTSRAAGIFAVLTLLAVPAAAGDSVISRGVDLWQTPADGSTFTDFAFDPIPADFFCSGSRPFAGRIALRGVPLVTGRPGVLGQTDTIVQRLDNAVFDRRGVAHTRIQVRAFSLVGVAPIETVCGSFHVTATLGGEQPITEMRIVRTHEGGGYYLAAIRLNVKLVFTPADGGPSLELIHHSDFPPSRGNVWSDRPGEKALQREGYVLVDTDGDLRADTYLPGTSNFAAGWRSTPGDKAEEGGTQPASTEHCGSGGGHCHIMLTVPERK